MLWVSRTCPASSWSRYDLAPWSTPMRPSDREAACWPVASPRPAASTPTSSTPGSATKGWNIPMLLLPPPTQATTQSGRRPNESRHCCRASRPMTDWNSRTISGYGCGPTAEPSR